MRAGALLLLAATAAHAQAPPSTRLEIDATGTAQATPDLLEATLAAERSGPDPAAVQQHVNAAIASAVHAATTVPGVEPRILGYDVLENDKHQWTASSRLALRSADSVHLLDLVGRLQSTGLILESLAWQLSPALHDREQAEATRNALTTLVRRAGDAASALGLHVDHLAEIRISGSGDFNPRPLGVMRALTAIAPSAPAAPLSVEVTASGTVLLRP